jgi:hypothetical protein
MNLLSKLQSPAALILEGFIAGAILFFALGPIGGGRAPASTLGGGSVLATLQM